MYSDKSLIYEQYVLSSRRYFNLNTVDEKCCMNCGSMIPINEVIEENNKRNQKIHNFLMEQKKKKTEGKPNGYILDLNFEKKMVAIAVGFERDSENPKTGDMIQVCIIHSDMKPSEALSLKLDAETYCKGCIHNSQGLQSCYVNVVNYDGIYEAFVNGCYPFIDDENNVFNGNIAEAFRGRAVRFGSYGDPSNIPLDIVEKIVKVSSVHTGYTHRWRDTDQRYKQFFMASCDTEMDYIMANSRGWRTFRVSGEWDLQSHAKLGDRVNVKEIPCLNSVDGKQCSACGLCNGMTSSNAKNILIKAHGVSYKESRFKMFHDFVAKFGTPEDPSVANDSSVPTEHKTEIPEKKSKYQKREFSTKEIMDLPFTKPEEISDIPVTTSTDPTHRHWKDKVLRREQELEREEQERKTEKKSARKREQEIKRTQDLINRRRQGLR